MITGSTPGWVGLCLKPAFLQFTEQDRRGYRVTLFTVVLFLVTSGGFSSAWHYTVGFREGCLCPVSSSGGVSPSCQRSNPPADVCIKPQLRKHPAWLRLFFIDWFGLSCTSSCSHCIRLMCERICIIQHILLNFHPIREGWITPLYVTVVSKTDWGESEQWDWALNHVYIGNFSFLISFPTCRLWLSPPVSCTSSSHSASPPTNKAPSQLTLQCALIWCARVEASVSHILTWAEMCSDTRSSGSTTAKASLSRPSETRQQFRNPCGKQFLLLSTGISSITAAYCVCGLHAWLIVLWDGAIKWKNGSNCNCCCWETRSLWACSNFSALHHSLTANSRHPRLPSIIRIW